MIFYSFYKWDELFENIKMRGSEIKIKTIMLWQNHPNKNIMLNDAENADT